MTPAERHRAYAAHFADLAAGVSDWDAPAPVAGWTARDVVGHLVTWLPGLLAAGGSVRITPGPSVAQDPVAAWAYHRDAVQEILDDPASAAVIFAHPRIPADPLPQVIDQFYTTDVFMHTWDLATASGQEPGLDRHTCADLLAGMEPLDDMLRASGQYGPRVPVADDADAVDRLVAFIGRDPEWTATTAPGSTT